ncbi:MAG: serine--tRNA ligase [Candidatus Pacebacteria bacterium]|nr:serine--tRNA ligase [Candidatus Paceibacterota bacterium]
MIDIKFIRENKDKIKDNCLKRGVDLDIDELLDLDEKRRKHVIRMEEISSRKNKASKVIAFAKKEDEKKQLISQMKKLDKEGDRIKKELSGIRQKFEALIYMIPNLSLENVPFGKDESSNVVLKESGRKPRFKFEPKSYLELSEKLDLVDVERGAKVSGTRFAYLKNEAVLIEFAIIKLAFDVLAKQGFIPLIPPVLIKPEMMKGMGYIDSKKDREERYFLEKDNLFLIGTSEQAVGPMHKDEVFKEKELPKRYAAFSSCFREEAGSYGKDTKGILRVHQFDKVEMFSFSKPEDSEKEHRLILSMEEKLMKLLKISYRVVQLCSGDLSRPSASTYDIESWLPGQNQYRETHSASNCTDFQARRLNIRYRRENGNKLEFVHTLNGTAFAIGRTLIAVIENYQQKDGSVKMPAVLKKYLPFNLIKPKVK